VIIKSKTKRRLGDPLDPVIFMSNGTHLSNFAVGKKEYPLYMTIGHQLSKIRHMPSTHTVVMVALQQIEMTNCNIPHQGQD